MGKFVSLQPIAWVARYHPSGEGFGSPFTFTFVMTRYDDEATLIAGSKDTPGEFSLAIRRAIEEELAQLDITTARYYRVDSQGRKRKITRRVRKRV